MPRLLPSTVRTATALPHATPRASVKSTLGPGTMMIRIDATKNVASWLPPITRAPCWSRSVSAWRLAPMEKPMVAAKNAVPTPTVPPRSHPTIRTMTSRVSRT